MSSEMKILTWTANSMEDYTVRVQPKIHVMLSSLGKNSVHAGTSIIEALHLLIGAQQTEVSMRAILIAQDLRFILHAAQGAFPTEALYQQICILAKNEEVKRLSWQTFAKRQPAHSPIFRILVPVEYACFDVSGKKITLLFQHPFKRSNRCTVAGLVQKLHIERKEIIY